MAGGQSSESRTSTPRKAEQLDRIAELIGRPGEVGHPLLEISELLRLWVMIEAGDDRRKLLEAAREFARA